MLFSQRQAAQHQFQIARLDYLRLLFTFAFGPMRENKMRIVAPVVERLAHGPDAFRQILFIDIAPIPKFLEQFATGNEPVTVLDEIDQ